MQSTWQGRKGTKRFTTKRYVRANTLIELLLVMALTVTLMIVMTTLYAFVAYRTSDSVSQYNSYRQMDQFFKALEETLNGAKDCSTGNFGSQRIYIKCEMPDKGTDRDGDGILDSYLPTSVNKMNQEVFGTGMYVWYYNSDSTGRPGNYGIYWFRAVRSNSSTITDANIDRKWSYLSPNQPRIYLPANVHFDVTVPRQFRVYVRIFSVYTPRLEDQSTLTKQRKGSDLELDRHFFVGNSQ